MSTADEKRLSSKSSHVFARTALDAVNTSARASVVNRTHRIVRERAKAIAARRSRVRSLWIPMTVSSALLVIICSAVWNVLEQYEVLPDGVPEAGNQFLIPDASNQFLVLLLWFLPMSMALLALVLFRRTRKHADKEAA
jgi:hypothetical protein